MRVIAGAYRGRKLKPPPGLTARPTADRVKEAMFGAIQFDIAKSRVLDAFAGSGALGIEALSRGAAQVDFVEKDPACIRVLEENLRAIGAANARVFRGDVLKLLPGMGQYDIVLLDPPYEAGLYEAVLKALAGGAIRNGGLVVLECRKSFDLSDMFGYNLTKRKNYGDISVAFLSYGERA
jgi:16S rRNA (guanine966-N2)-methyltransferase